ncbi:polysaccharide deacetylase, partial [Acinetobacter cumulans]
MLKKIILSFCLGLSNVAIAKSVALSFDDGLDPSINSEAQQINENILSTLKQNKIHAIFYPSISKIGGA